MDKGFLSMATDSLGLTEQTCVHCGHTGLDVHGRLQHVGGQGDVMIVECDNVVECWHRVDEQREE